MIAAKAVAFKEAMHPSFRDYAAQIVRNAQALAQGLAAEGFRMVSGGTDNHLLLVDLRTFDADMSGKIAQEPDRPSSPKQTTPPTTRRPVRHERRAHRHAGGDHEA